MRLLATQRAHKHARSSREVLQDHSRSCKITRMGAFSRCRRHVRVLGLKAWKAQATGECVVHTRAHAQNVRAGNALACALVHACVLVIAQSGAGHVPRVSKVRSGCGGAETALDASLGEATTGQGCERLRGGGAEVARTGTVSYFLFRLARWKRNPISSSIHLHASGTTLLSFDCIREELTRLMCTDDFVSSASCARLLTRNADEVNLVVACVLMVRESTC
eukprot:6204375-Pleurochrysis_carterae.AAC.1